MPLSINSRLNQRYKIIEVIAVGGMGSIYRAIDESLNIEVAVKENLFRSDESSRQFHYEAKILANLKHPNLPRVTDHFSIPEQGQYLVMDFVYGEDLKDYLDKQGLLKEADARLIGATICNALTYLHNQHPSVIHRDIKPGNIKISPNGDVYLVDFGLAKQTVLGQETTTGAQALTPGYAPPEQYGQGTEPRSDIYSLGATLYAAVTGEVPADALARTIGSDDLLPLASLNASISPAFAHCIEKAMSINAQDRYQTAEEFKQALLDSAEIDTQQKGRSKPQKPALGLNELPTRVIGSPVPSTTGSTLFSSAGTIQKNKPAQRSLSLFFILFLIVAIIAMGIWVVSRVLTQRTPPPLAEQPSTLEMTNSQQDSTTAPALPVEEIIPSIEASVNPTTEGSDAALPVTPQASTKEAGIGGGSGLIAFASNRSGIPQIWTMQADGSDFTQITNLTDGACYPDWSPDGTKLIITSPCRAKQELYKGSALFILNADGSGLHPILSLPGGDFHAVWSPDGSKLLFSSLRDNINMPHIYVMDMDNNQTVTRLTSPSSYDNNAVWSPDGNKIAFDSTRLGVSQIWIMDADGSNIIEFTVKDSSAGYMPDWSPNGEMMVFSFGSTRGLFAKQVLNRTAPAVEVTTLRPVRDAAFSPDDYWIAFESMENEFRDIFIVTINGSNLQNLTKDEYEDFHPVWQP
jgi:eukaryotic-like serine/threonine-protein kinase